MGGERSAALPHPNGRSRLCFEPHVDIIEVRAADENPSRKGNSGGLDWTWRMRERALQYGAAMRSLTPKTPKKTKIDRKKISEKKSEERLGPITKGVDVPTRFPTSGTPKKVRIDRKKISEKILEERLGLNDPWIDYTDQKGEVKWESFAPDDLPQFIRSKLKSAEVKEVEMDVKRLVEAGCCKPVIYFCLAQLSPEAEQRRSEGEFMRPLSKPGSIDGEELPLPDVRQLLASGEHLEAVANSARKTRKIIHKYRRELMFAADAAEPSEHPLPGSMMTTPEHATDALVPSSMKKTPENAGDALALLNYSLGWVATLAEAYSAPSQKTLLKNKGLLYLTAYVTAHPDERKIRGHAHAGEDDALSGVATSVSGKEWSSSDLREKLQNFKKDHLRLY